MTTTIQNGTLAIHCPSWCRTHEHDPNDVSPRWSDDGITLNIEHPGPGFGPFACVAGGNTLAGDLLPEVTWDTVGIPEVFEKEEQLRQFIADAQAALAWMESVRASGTSI